MTVARVGGRLWFSLLALSMTALFSKLVSGGLMALPCASFALPIVWFTVMPKWDAKFRPNDVDFGNIKKLQGTGSSWEDAPLYKVWDSFSSDWE